MRRVDSGSRRHACDCGGVQAILDEFDEYLALQCGRSVHTRRAYLGDLRSLFAFLADRGSSLDALTLSVLRSWLADLVGASLDSLLTRVARLEALGGGPQAAGVIRPPEAGIWHGEDFSI